MPQCQEPRQRRRLTQTKTRPAGGQSLIGMTRQFVGTIVSTSPPTDKKVGTLKKQDRLLTNDHLRIF